MRPISAQVVIGTAEGGLGADNSAASGVPLFATGTVTLTGTNGSGNFLRSAGTAAITTGKTFSVSDNVTLASDGTGTRTLNIGTGGTLGTAAYTAATAYEVPLTFSTGLTRTVNAVTVNSSQNIGTLSNLTGNGFVKTSGGTGALSIDTNTYLTSSTGVSSITGTANQITASAATGAVTLSIPTNPTLPGNVTVSGTASGTSTTAAAILGKSVGLTENLYVGGIADVAGNVGVPAAGHLQLGSSGTSAANGGTIIGSGTTYDISILNKSGTAIFQVPTGTQTVNFLAGFAGGVALPATGTLLLGTSGASGANGGTLIGKGATYDISILNQAGSYVIRVPANTQNIEAGGNLTVSGTGTSSLAGTLNVSGPLQLREGTAAAPSLALINDGSTGLYIPVDHNLIGLTVGGTRVLIVDSSSTIAGAPGGGNVSLPATGTVGFSNGNGVGLSIASGVASATAADFTSLTKSGTSTTAAAILGKSMGLTENFNGAGNINTTAGEIQSLGSRVNYNLSVYAAGTVYTLTASDALVDFGTTDPTLVLDKAGTYLLMGRAYVAYNGATYVANQTVTAHLRRTNNTAADIGNATTTAQMRVITTITDSVGVMQMPAVIYTTANTNDSISVYGSVSATPAAGTVTVNEASIVAIRLY